jgi:F-type H+-transporting ATPase subunit b
MTRARVRRVSLLLLAVAAMCAGLAILSRAQEPASPQPEPKRGPGFGQQLVKESREAAGEDDNAKLKHSSSVLWLAKHTGLNIEHTYWLSIFLNFVGIGLLVHAFYKWGIPTLMPAPGPYMRQRSIRIRQAIEDARQASEDARRRIGEVELRLSQLGTEIGEMRASAERDAAVEEERIKAAAAEDARKIIVSAEQEIAATVKSARRELTAYAADLAVGLARKQIHVDAATDQVLVRSFAQRIVSSDGGTKGKQ